MLCQQNFINNLQKLHHPFNLFNEASRVGKYPVADWPIIFYHIFLLAKKSLYTEIDVTSCSLYITREQEARDSNKREKFYSQDQ